MSIALPLASLHLRTLFTLLLLLHRSVVGGFRQYTQDDLKSLRDEVRQEFQFAYQMYLDNAYPFDELRPLSCAGTDTWGKYQLTLIDSLDTLVTMGNYSEFRRVVEILKQKPNFDADINVSVFETNIRIVGGLLSAHLMSRRADPDGLEKGWPCRGPLLRLAEDVAKRLLPAFQTKTLMPYGTVNLRYGVPVGETTITSTAGVGTFIVEFGTLSRLTGDPVYEETALNALYALFNHRSSIGLFGNHIDVQTGRWTAQDAGIGSGVDSFFEYLVKGAVLLNRPELLAMFSECRRGIDKYLKREDWYVWVSMNKGQVTLPVFQSLEAFYPGILSIIGSSNAALRNAYTYHTVWKQYGFLPEIFQIPTMEAAINREAYPLRPEHAESAMYLYRATEDPYFIEVGEDMLRSIQTSAKTKCGYATIRNVRDHSREDRMESFFLAETLKYLYLLFDSDNFLHNDGRAGIIFDTPNGECLLESSFQFNTEAHPIDSSALRCCSEVPKEMPLMGFKSSSRIGEVIKKKERPVKRPRNMTKPRRKESPFDKYEITLAEIQQAIEQAKKHKQYVAEVISAATGNQTTAMSTSKSDDSLILAVDKDSASKTNTSNVSEHSSAIDLTGVVQEFVVQEIFKEDLESFVNELNEGGGGGSGKVVITSEEISATGDRSEEAEENEVRDHTERPIEIMKLPSAARDADDKSAAQAKLTELKSTPQKSTHYSESNTSDLAPPSNDTSSNYTIVYKDFARDDGNEHIVMSSTTSSSNSSSTSSDGKNNSVLPEFVQNLMKAMQPQRPNFDAQRFYQHLRKHSVYRNETWTHQYELLRCPAQPFLQRFSILGQFFY